MPTKRELEAAAEATAAELCDRDSPRFPAYVKARRPSVKTALEAAEKVRMDAKGNEYGDIGMDGADRLYKNVLGTWVAQNRIPSTPVYPVKIIARWENGEYHAFKATTKREAKLLQLIKEIYEDSILFGTNRNRV